MPPPVQFTERLQVRLRAGTLAALRKRRTGGQSDAAMVRAAIEEWIAGRPVAGAAKKGKRR